MKTRKECPYKEARGFITSALPNYNPQTYHEWECIIDFCGRYNGEPTNVSAWLHRPSMMVHFIGQWWDAKPWHVHKKPSEASVWTYAEHNTIWGKRVLAARRQEEKRKKASNEVEKFYEKNGSYFLYAEFRKPDGEVLKFNQPCGIYDLKSMRQRITPALATLPKGTVVQKFKVFLVSNETVEKWWNWPQVKIQNRPLVLPT
jgi:hypothetical protein